MNGTFNIKISKITQSNIMINTILFTYITVQCWQRKFYIITKHAVHYTSQKQFWESFQYTLWNITLGHLSSHALHFAATRSNMCRSLCQWKVQHATLISAKTTKRAQWKYSTAKYHWAHMHSYQWHNNCKCQAFSSEHSTSSHHMIVKYC